MWIRFDRAEPPAPSLPLATPAGSPVAVADFYGRASLVLFFAHAGDCPACLAWRRHLAAESERYRELGAEALVIVPEAADGDAGRAPRVLVDRGNTLRERYAALMTPAAPGGVMVFILNEQGAPQAAWLGPDAPTGTVGEELATRLQHAALACPE